MWAIDADSEQVAMGSEGEKSVGVDEIEAVVVVSVAVAVDPLGILSRMALKRGVGCGRVFGGAGACAGGGFGALLLDLTFFAQVVDSKGGPGRLGGWIVAESSMLPLPTLISSFSTSSASSCFTGTANLPFRFLYQDEYVSVASRFTFQSSSQRRSSGKREYISLR